MIDQLPGLPAGISEPGPVHRIVKAVLEAGCTTGSKPDTLARGGCCGLRPPSDLSTGQCFCQDRFPNLWYQTSSSLRTGFQQRSLRIASSRALSSLLQADHSPPPCAHGPAIPQKLPNLRQESPNPARSGSPAPEPGAPCSMRITVRHHVHAYWLSHTSFSGSHGSLTGPQFALLSAL